MPPAPLDYSPTGNRRRNRLLAAVIILTTCSSLAYLLHHHYPTLANWYDLHTTRHAALTHICPASTPLLTLLPTDTNATWPSIYLARCGPRDTVWFDTWCKLFPTPHATPGSMLTLFLHQRLTPNGQPRLVALNTSPMWNPDGLYLTADLRLFTTGSFLSPRLTELTVQPNPHLPPSGTIPHFPGVIVRLGFVPWSSDFKLYPAQPDPQDPTKFSLPYTLNQTKGSFTLQLTNDNSAQLTNPTPLPEPQTKQ